MKKIIIIVLTISIFIVMLSFTLIKVKINVDGPVIEFNKTVHNYDTLEFGANGECVFIITNSGNAPLTISNAKGSCGCTVPSWPKEPINPGQSSQLKVTYDTKRSGPINKSVTVYSNGSNETTSTLKITGFVNKNPNSSNVNENIKKEKKGIPYKK